MFSAPSGEGPSMNGDRVFHIGEKVVYPNHGVGIIEQISSRTMGTTIEKFYLLKIAASSLKVMVPFANVGNVGMRPVVRNGEVQKIVDYLSSGECINAADWKDRFKENSDRMRTGSLSDVAAVLKSLLILGRPSRSPSAKKRCWSAPAICWSARSPSRGTARRA